MKKILLLIPVTAVLAFTACKKPVQEEGPLEMLDEDYIFDPVDKNGNYSEQFLSDIYAQMPQGFNRIGGGFTGAGSAILDAATDDAVPSQNGGNIDNLIYGRLDAVFNPDDAWGKNYTAIRKVNVFLAKVDRVPKAADTRAYWKTEARFLRALFYFELVKRYGGVPIVGDNVYAYTDKINPPRNSFSDCIEYIVGELDAIKPIARDEKTLDEGDYGRATQGIIMALKSRVLLYAASPLFNGGNIGNGDQQRRVSGYPDYSIERWKRAALAAREVVALNYYKLGTNYRDVFLKRGNTNLDIILPYLRGKTRDIGENNGPVGFTQSAAGRGLTSPTQDLAEAFLMTNGKPITDPSSGYNPDQPAKNRDARFATIFMYNGMRWFKRPLQTYEGGLDKPGGATVQTKTSYYMLKFIFNGADQSGYSDQDYNFPIIRYAEILLNLAEAENEVNGPVKEVTDALKAVRDRGFKQALPIGLTQETCRKLIRQERRVELVFEEHRYYDLRRWKTAEQELNKQLYGQKIVMNADSTFSYSKVPVGTIRFDAPRMYLYPVPFSELQRNANLIQNRGWE
ncbi:RagB/SusD family nutrient uptake outer membrane protein [Chitinophaga solisilvae]|uniref:RagB/SusD family nutrient uptake outer membrane protein n=1 Tax=Chitinophaga solisilvae TaxID=1233460 RepID=UPI00136E3C1B|nr:RagB/SusD family nutrient uptake outer membrane protein [Chitinophaga solisilvae]